MPKPYAAKVAKARESLTEWMTNNDDSDYEEDFEAEFFEAEDEDMEHGMQRNGDVQDAR